MKKYIKILLLLVLSIKAFSQKNQTFFYLQKSTKEKYNIYYQDYEECVQKKITTGKNDNDTQTIQLKRPQVFILSSEITLISFIVCPGDTINIIVDLDNQINVHSSRKSVFDFAQNWLGKHSVVLSNPPHKLFRGLNTYDNIETYKKLLDSLNNDTSRYKNDVLITHFQKEVQYYYLQRLLSTFNNTGKRKGDFADSVDVDKRTVMFFQNLKQQLYADADYCLNSVRWYSGTLWLWNDFMCKYYYKSGFELRDFFYCGLKNLDSKIRDVVLHDYIDYNLKTNKWPSSTDSDYPKIIESFKSVCTQESLLNDILKRVEKPSSYLLNSLSEDPILIRENKEILHWKDLLLQKRGKVIYLDFWASWCKPCLEEIPFSLALQKEFKGKEIEFLFVSIDDNSDNWLVSQKALKMSSQNSFLSNSVTNGLGKFFNVDTIPRYIVVDKFGNVINSNATRPSDITTKTILNEILKR